MIIVHCSMQRYWKFRFNWMISYSLNRPKHKAHFTYQSLHSQTLCSLSFFFYMWTLIAHLIHAPRPHRLYNTLKSHQWSNSFPLKLTLSVQGVIFYASDHETHPKLIGSYESTSLLVILTTLVVMTTSWCTLYWRF